MIHTVKISDHTPNGKRIVEELRNNYEEVEFIGSTVNTTVPEGYMTSDEFWKASRVSIDKICKKHGLL
jgi:hypothetical protein